MYSIGIFTNELSLARILKLDQVMGKENQITYLPYTSPQHLRFLYEQNQNQFDGLLFSGSYPYNVIRNFFPEVEETPHAYFDLSPLDYYKTIAYLSVQRPELDFTRVYFDRPQVPVDFESIFLCSDAPMLGTAPIDWQKVEAVDWYQPLQTYYKELWDSGAVDLLVTRFASMAEFFERNHIRHYYLAPSRETMLETYQNLLAQLDTRSIRETAACIGLLQSPEKLTEEQTQMLWDALQTYHKQKGMPFLIYRQEKWFELTTNISVLKELTQQYTISPMAAFLSERLPFSVCIGWGCSSSVMDAQRNGHRALKQAMQLGTTATFIVTDDNRLIGPLSSERRITYSDSPDPALFQLSEKVGISPLYLSKIQGVLRQKGACTLASEELAFFLDVTTRSASRILNKLEAAGVAKVEYNRQLNLRGRPAKIYSIDLDQFPG